MDERGRSEGIDGAMAAKVRNALVLRKALPVPHGAEVCLHRPVLYNSGYRADDEMLVNQHVYGIGAAQAPVVRLHWRDGGTLFATHADAVERTWAAAVPPS